jgi:sortase B
MKKSVWHLAATLARGADHILNTAIALLLVVAILYSGFGLWDTWNIYENAGVDSALLQYKPAATGEDAPNPTLEELQALYEDVCGWLTVDDTNIDYPVVQGEDNLVYLNQAVDGSFSYSGSIFLDCRNDRNFTDFYSLFYGHHMAGSVMFGEIPSFLETDYFQSHTTGSLFTPEHSYSIEWFACVEINAFDSMLFVPTSYNDEASATELLEYIKEIATQYREIGVAASDQIVALSTCAEAATDGRVMLIGRLSPGAQT